MKRALNGWAQGKKTLKLATAFITILSAIAAMSQLARAQDDNEDPPARVARLGYLQGSVSFEPAGENDWVQAVPNRPMTTDDKLWADQNSRAEVQLGSSMIELAPNTGFSFLNLDDRTTQMEITAGAINVRVWSLDRDNVFEIDTPNQAFTVTEPGRYRVEASENGDYSVVTIWQGAGESTGNGQTYTLHAGQRTTFSGTSSLNAEVEQIGSPDDFDRWSESRWSRYDDSPSARYCSRDVVGFDDLDEYGSWRDDPQYGHVWFPRVNADWAPYHEGHWAWIDPWGWTWVDADPWGYAPFHYGRWAFVGNSWGWVPGPVNVYPVYAPALVVFVGGGGLAFGGNVAWFPLGPREVYVPSYRVSQAYVNRVNITNTTVNQTTITNVYNTTIIRNNTNITNVTYVNRNARGAVTAVPQRAFASAQPVQRSAVAVNSRQIASAPISTRAAVPPAQQAVLGIHANTANHVAAPPRAIATRAVVAKAAPPPRPPAFAARQQALAQHPGQPVPRQQLRQMASSAAATAAPLVKRAPPGRPATPTPAPANRSGNPPARNERPGANPPTVRPQPTPQPAPNNRPEPNQPAPNNRPEMNRPQPNRPEQPPARTDRPPSAQPNNRPEPNQPNNRPETNRPQPNRPEQPPARPERPSSVPQNNVPERQPAPNARPENNRAPQPPRNQNPSRPETPSPDNRPQPERPQSRPAPPPQHPSANDQRRPDQRKPDQRKNNEENQKPQ
ncbi:MAG TPA: DUF6600 domain-containing protein [Candidatus Sulfotelmatobacter sp.]|nr:DUF6600 domain-containing protein [Candidatus Sulfotelmatobacter sp.]